MDKRPTLNTKINISDFLDFYWLKKELVIFCRNEKLKTTGSKLELTNRITHYLKTGKQIKLETSKNISRSKFDWSKAALSPATIITDNYKNSENVRLFFQEKLGSSFKFNVRFMNWMKVNVGKTLNDAIQEWIRIKTEKRDESTPVDIAPQFEYNRYLRDFLADNPGQARSLGIKLWKIKKAMRGNNAYSKEDLKLL